MKRNLKRRRPYRMERRASAAKETRARIVAAARALLSAEGFASVGIDEIARTVGVTRRTVYNHFATRRDLLEAVNAATEEEADFAPARDAIQRGDLRGLLDELSRFWLSAPEAFRNLRLLSWLDANARALVQEKDANRHRVLARLVRPHVRGRRARDVVDVLQVLTAFETVDALARAGRAPGEVAGLLWSVVVPLLRLPPAPRTPRSVAVDTPISRRTWP